MRRETLTQEQGKQLAALLLGVVLPVTAEELKQAYRIACKKLHTDTSGSEATKDRFIQMKQLYDQLTSLKLDWIFKDAATTELRTSMGTPLSELGLGLGPNKNGRDCEHCQHKGYTEQMIEGYQPCPWCFGGWTRTQPCRRCDGKGRYMRNGVDKGECFGCKGSGTYRSPSLIRCQVCRGTGGKYVPAGTAYHVCYYCQGTGEIEIFNPVIPKGRLL